MIDKTQLEEWKAYAKALIEWINLWENGGVHTDDSGSNPQPAPPPPPVHGK